MTLKDAIIQVLTQANKPLHKDTITRRLKRLRLYKFRSQTPDASVGARLYMSIKNNPDTPFVQTGPATFALRDRQPSTEPARTPAVRKFDRKSKTSQKPEMIVVYVYNETQLARLNLEGLLK